MTLIEILRTVEDVGHIRWSLGLYRLGLDYPSLFSEFRSLAWDIANLSWWAEL